MLDGVDGLVCLGDSITEGADVPAGYVRALRNRLEPRVRVVNAGIGGHRSIEMRQRFASDVLAHEPGLVTISVGVNDVWRFYDSEDSGVPLDVYAGHLDSMVREAVAAGAKVCVLCPTMVGEDFDAEPNRKMLAYRAAAAAVAERHGAVFVDLFDAFRRVIETYQGSAGKAHNLLTTDGVHMNDAGNALMATQVLRALGV